MAVSFCECFRTVVRKCRRSSAQAGSLVVVRAVVASRLPLCVALALVGAMMIVDVVIEDFGQLRWLGMFFACKVQFAEVLPVSGAVFSPPAISSKLEMEGREGFFSAGGEGGDCGCSLWYACWRCCC